MAISSVFLSSGFFGGLPVLMALILRQKNLSANPRTPLAQRINSSIISRVGRESSGNKKPRLNLGGSNRGEKAKLATSVRMALQQVHSTTLSRPSKGKFSRDELLSCER